jgi:ribosomal-protein-serine acetyltransferase
MAIRTLVVNDTLVLEPLHVEDADELHAVIDANRTHLREWLTWVDAHDSVRVSRAFVARTRRQYRDESGLTFGLRQRGALVGIVGFNELDPENHSGEIGYWLASDSSGQGLMTAACVRLVRHGFESLELHRIVLQIATGNLRSTAIAERLGCTMEGVQREAQLLNGKWVDLAVWALLQSEWNERSG